MFASELSQHIWFWGIFDPWHNEEEDGQAIAAWMREQSWYTSSVAKDHFATLGRLYIRFCAMGSVANPTDVICCDPLRTS